MRLLGRTEWRTKRSGSGRRDGHLCEIPLESDCVGSFKSSIEVKSMVVDTKLIERQGKCFLYGRFCLGLLVKHE